MAKVKEKFRNVTFNVSESLIEEIDIFCKERGWNAKELTTGQMLFITNQPEYQNIIKNG